MTNPMSCCGEGWQIISASVRYSTGGSIGSAANTTQTTECPRKDLRYVFDTSALCDPFRRMAAIFTPVFCFVFLFFVGQSQVHEATECTDRHLHQAYEEDVKEFRSLAPFEEEISLNSSENWDNVRIRQWSAHMKISLPEAFYWYFSFLAGTLQRLQAWSDGTWERSHSRYKQQTQSREDRFQTGPQAMGSREEVILKPSLLKFSVILVWQLLLLRHIDIHWYLLISSWDYPSASSHIFIMNKLLTYWTGFCSFPNYVV